MTSSGARRAILLLGGSPDQVPLVHAARLLGLEVAVADREGTAPGLALADHRLVVSTRDVPALVEACRLLLACGVPLAGVCVMGSDVPHVVAAVASEMGWEGPSLETAALASHKLRMRQRFREAGVATPRFRFASTPVDVLAFWDAEGSERVVVKPADQAGSRGVRLVSERSEAADAFAEARAASGDGCVLVEEFVRGPQVSTETIVFDGRAATPGFADRNYADTEAYHPRILENGGWLGSALAQADQNAVRALVEAGAHALGIRRGVAKGDVVVHPTRGPMLIEMAARIGGGDFGATIVPLATGVELLPQALRVALGEAPDWDALVPRALRTVANRYVFLPAGRLEDVRGADEVRARPSIAKLELFVQPGATLSGVAHHGQRAGVFVVMGEDRAEVQREIDAAYDALAFRVNGRWYEGRPGGELKPALPAAASGGAAPGPARPRA